MQTVEEMLANTRREKIVLVNRLPTLLEDVDEAKNMETLHMDVLEKARQNQREMLEQRDNVSSQQTSDMEKEQMREQLRADLLEAEILIEELVVLHKLWVVKVADRKCESANMKWRISKLVEREKLLRALFSDYLNDDGSNESEPERGAPAEEEDITEHTSWHCTTGSELAESRRNPYCETQERAEERSEGVGTSSSLPGVATTCDNNETTICDGGTSSTTAPCSASMSNGSPGEQS
jgi:hypothetical protein